MKAAPCSQIINFHQFMKILIYNISIGERLTVVCEEEPRKTVFVKGHFKVINGKKVYVKAHHRKR